MSLKQAKRQISIETALGEDALVLNRVQVVERLSCPFEITADVSATSAEIDYSKVVGHPATIRLQLGNGKPRFFHGIISRLMQSGNEGALARYRATIVPWFWFLTRAADCRIFQHRKVLDIAEEVFSEHRFGSDQYSIKISETHPEHSYRVQYRETDFNFISRLLESEGIYYWFEHTKSGHKMVLADSINASKPAKGYESIDFHTLAAGAGQAREVITDWLIQHEVMPVEYTLKDFDFKKPQDPLKG
jgi:type VI secretion system secreted protein VgrG